jgi:general secretion pathway protein G
MKHEVPAIPGRHAFTLIELLIVVAILLLLAGIGAVNYQSAQARAKVARVQADMRTIATALETYRVEARAYPPAADGDWLLERPLDVLTTPVAHLGSLPRDPFSPAAMNFNPGIAIEGYQYKDSVTTSEGMPGETYGHIWRALPEKRYYLHSAGPNLVWDVLPYVEYDPTNGTVSVGDITRFGPM